jgi:hypothetical protein
LSDQSNSGGVEQIPDLYDYKGENIWDKHLVAFPKFSSNQTTGTSGGTIYNISKTTYPILNSQTASVDPDIHCPNCLGEGVSLIVYNGKRLKCTICLGKGIPPIPVTEI